MTHSRLRYPTRAELLANGRGLHGTPADRLSRAYTIEPSGCWRWSKALTSSGYGHFSIRGIYYQAHLLIYVLEVEPLPTGLEPDHLCRNRWCVNPSHIEFVTHAVNTQRGSGARLTQLRVAEIRRRWRAGQGVRMLARQYGVSPATISRVTRGQRWIDEPTTERAVA